MTTPTSTTASPPAPTASTSGRHTQAILAIILVSYFMILLDNSIIFTALPTIHTAMRYSTTGLAWVQDAYTLVFGGLLLLGARAGDLLGRRRVFVFGLAVFALASLLIGVAPTGWWLIAARAVQGVGAATSKSADAVPLISAGLIGWPRRCRTPGTRTSRDSRVLGRRHAACRGVTPAFFSSNE